MNMFLEQDRRAFLAAIGGLATLTAVAEAQAPPQPAVSGPIDISWFDTFKGKHKQVFDLGSFVLPADPPRRQPVTYFVGHKDVSKLEPPDDINAICAISHK